MNKTPHFVLFSRTRGQSAASGQPGGDWYFRLQSKSGEKRLEATDFEPGATRERLELLAVVRGLEALEQPSTVTLVTGSRQIPRAIRRGLEYWRLRDWKWERYGEKVPMKNADLWRRIDRAMQIHDVRCRQFRVDQAHPNHALSSEAPLRRPHSLVNRLKHGRTVRPGRLPLAAMARWTANSLRRAADRVQRLIPEASPNPRLTM